MIDVVRNEASQEAITDERRAELAARVREIAGVPRVVRIERKIGILGAENSTKGGLLREQTCAHIDFGGQDKKEEPPLFIGRLNSKRHTGEGKNIMPYYFTNLRFGEKSVKYSPENGPDILKTTLVTKHINCYSNRGTGGQTKAKLL